MQNQNANPKAKKLEAAKNSIPAERRLAALLRDGRFALSVAAIGLYAGAALIARADLGSRRETRLAKARVESIRAERADAGKAVPTRDTDDPTAFTLGEARFESMKNDAEAEIDFAMAAPFLATGTEPIVLHAIEEQAPGECKAPRGGCCSFIIEALQEDFARAAGETLSELPTL